MSPQYLFDIVSLLAGGQSITEKLYEVMIPFDGQDRMVESTFVPGNQVLIGTALLREYRLTVNFKTGDVRMERLP